jgi:hypothetical protein
MVKFVVGPTEGLLYGEDGKFTRDGMRAKKFDTRTEALSYLTTARYGGFVFKQKHITVK